MENTLWANTVLASGSAVGVVIYTGSDTRSVMNTTTPRSKVQCTGKKREETGDPHPLFVIIHLPTYMCCTYMYMYVRVNSCIAYCTVVHGLVFLSILATVPLVFAQYFPCHSSWTFPLSLTYGGMMDHVS